MDIFLIVLFLMAQGFAYWIFPFKTSQQDKKTYGNSPGYILTWWLIRIPVINIVALLAFALVFLIVLILAYLE